MQIYIKNLRINSFASMIKFLENLRAVRLENYLERLKLY